MKNAGQRGFTLVELLTVIAIMLILIGLVARGGNPIRATIELERQTGEVANLIRTARQNAVTTLENEGVFPSYGISAARAPDDLSNSGSVVLYARNVPKNASENVGIGDVCYKVAIPEVNTIASHTFTHGVFVKSVEHVDVDSTLSTLPLNREGVVFFLRPIPTTYFGFTNRSCGAGPANDPLPSGEVRITIENGEAQQRIVTVNSVGKVEIRLP